MLALLNAGRVPPSCVRARSLVATAAREYKEIPSFREVEWPEEWPFADPRFFARADETPDTEFYDQPRFVTHIDDGAIGAITDYYASTMKEGADVLDLCSSWISHLPPDLKLGRVAGVGMNKEELSRNERLGEFEVQDLNVNPKLPYDDESFDFVCNVVSVDYLTKPQEIFAEMHRVLRPGGKAIMSFSNRCFPTKAIGIWTQTDDAGHLWIVGSYFKFTPDCKWSDVRALDISAKPGMGDPMFVVEGQK
jgi:SAM-dependent methyltransferase